MPRGFTRNSLEFAIAEEMAEKGAKRQESGKPENKSSEEIQEEIKKEQEARLAKLRGGFTRESVGHILSERYGFKIKGDPEAFLHSVEDEGGINTKEREEILKEAEERAGFMLKNERAIDNWAVNSMRGRYPRGVSEGKFFSSREGMKKLAEVGREFWEREQERIRKEQEKSAEARKKIDEAFEVPPRE